MRSMFRRKTIRRYTNIGQKIASLAVEGKGAPQTQVAKALEVSQQTVSKKLRGECAILLADLEKLAKKFKVPMMHFFENYDGKPSDLAKAS